MALALRTCQPDTGGHPTTRWRPRVANPCEANSATDSLEASLLYGDQSNLVTTNEKAGGNATGFFCKPVDQRNEDGTYFDAQVPYVPVQLVIPPAVTALGVKVRWHSPPEAPVF